MPEAERHPDRLDEALPRSQKAKRPGPGPREIGRSPVEGMDVK